MTQLGLISAITKNCLELLVEKKRIKHICILFSILIQVLPSEGCRHDLPQDLLGKSPDEALQHLPQCAHRTLQ